ncbi:PREDICTED: uncharacterized protein LOC104704669 [Camelina sativa]|uniref:Uncharacterized protein LOC104704669 n=1 Tax=Camelina sativa TaxID=90675 RepID=A0ABM0T0P0_CAMSA|nr:PREDICTED: uncharacterized protein LOC104704669 [Camelina sativa]
MSSQSETIVTSDTSLLHNVNMSNVTKLTATNFMMWKRQVHALLDGHELAGYLDASISAPPKTITSDGVDKVNPAYSHWKRHDKLILASLLGAISVEVQPLMSKADTSAQIWSTLTDTYAKPSWGHIKQIREQIKTWKKGARSIDDYVQGLTTRFNQLALLGKPLEHEDQVDYLLGGLPEDFKPVIDQIDGRDTPPSLTEIHEKLINYDLKLQALARTTSSSVLFTANTVSFKPFGGHNNNQHFHNPNRETSRGQWHNQQGFSRGSQGRRYQGRCELCGVYDHSARRWSQLQSSGRGSSSGGATHHLTTDLSNLALNQPYTGGEEVTIADGSGLPITHTGSALLPTPSRFLALKDVLYVPNVKDLCTGARLLQGRTKNELYEWPLHRHQEQIYLLGIFD